MITTLSFYDMDGTLFNTPLPDIGKKIWKEKTGTEYPHVGWWSKPETLNPDVFDIKPFPSVLNQLRSDQTKNDTYTVLLTSRMQRLQPEIENLLKVNGITFDDLSLKSGNEEKDDRIKSFLAKFPDVQTINVYDDRDKEMVVFSKMKDQFKGMYNVNIYRVTDGNIALVEGENKLKNMIFEEISIYKKTIK